MPITVVAAEPIEGKVKREIAIVSSLGEHVVGNYVLVRVADEVGHVGLGEASVTCIWSGETQVGAISLVREVLAPLIAGAAGLLCTIGSNLEREVATAAMAHVAVATPNIVCERFPGDLIGPVYFERPLT